MIIRSLLLSIAFSLVTHALNGGPQEKNAEMLAAQQDYRDNQVRLLIENGADVNARSPAGSTVLMYAIKRCGAVPHKREEAVEQVKFLLSKSADPNVSDRFGITAMMIADRVGSATVVKLLTQFGARSFNKADPKVKAAFVRIDADLLALFVDNWHVQNDGLLTKQIEFQELENMTRGITEKVVARKGIDILGNPYILRPCDDELVWVNPKTVSELRTVVDRDYWVDFLPKKQGEKER